jgi:hypothetical protein
VNLKRIVHDDGAGPDAVHQLVFGDEFTGRLGENLDNIEGTTTNRHRRSKNP